MKKHNLFPFLIITITLLLTNCGDDVIVTLDSPIACFEASSNECDVNDCTITFSAECSDNVTNYKWDFNNDGIFDMEGRDKKEVDFTYTSEGRKTVKLEVRNSGGEHETLQTVEVNAAVLMPTEVFSNTYLDNVDARGTVITSTMDGGYAVIGFTSGIGGFLLKFNDKGEMVWDSPRYYGGMWFNDIIEGKNGDLIILGSNDSKMSLLRVSVIDGEPKPGFPKNIDDGDVTGRRILEYDNENLLISGRGAGIDPTCQNRCHSVLVWKTNRNGDKRTDFPKHILNGDSFRGDSRIAIGDNGEFYWITVEEFSRFDDTGNLMEGYPKDIELNAYTITQNSQGGYTIAGFDNNGTSIVALDANEEKLFPKTSTIVDNSLIDFSTLGYFGNYSIAPAEIVVSNSLNGNTLVTNNGCIWVDACSGSHLSMIIIDANGNLVEGYPKIVNHFEVNDHTATKDGGFILLGQFEGKLWLSKISDNGQ